MTRVNTVPVSWLTDQHLFAEYREIGRIPIQLQKSIKAIQNKNPEFNEEQIYEAIEAKISKEYLLGTGHVFFFYNKGEWLANRSVELIKELKDRGLFKVEDYKEFRSHLFPPYFFYNEWKPVIFNDIMTNLGRLKEKIDNSPRPYFYTLRGFPIRNWSQYKRMINHLLYGGKIHEFKS